MRKPILLAFCLVAAACSGSNGSSSGSTTGTTTTGTTTTGGSSGSTTTTSTSSSSGSTGTTGGCGQTGASCSVSNPCCTGYLCSGGGSCVLPGHEGDACDGTVGCGNSLTCTSGFCRASCSSTAVCLALGDDCSSGGTCCGALTCSNGICTTSHLPTCKGDGEACTTAADCCGDASAGTQFACVSAGDGGSICHLAALGDACDPTANPCGPGLTCKPAPVTTTGSSSSSSSTVTSSSSGSGSGSTSATTASGSDSGSTSTGSNSGSTSATTTSGSDSGSTSAGSDSGSTSSGSDSGSTGVNPTPTRTGGTPPTMTCQYTHTNPAGPTTCNITSSGCYAGDPCDPNNDYCAKGGSLKCDPTSRTCTPQAGIFGDCSSTADCVQVGGNQALSCSGNTLFSVLFSDLYGSGSGSICAPKCSSDSDCTTAIAIDSSNSNPPELSMLCDQSGGVPACQPVLCWDGAATLDGSCTDPNNSSDPYCGSGLTSDPSKLYQPCTGHPNTICVPQYYGDLSTVFGFCQAVAPTTASTVGNACDPAVSAAYPDLLCGADSWCMGGVCSPLCDVQQGGSNNIPGCSASQTCVSLQGVNLVSTYQVGGCDTPCDPWTADATKSGCTTFCGGPRAKCDWVFGDRIAGQALGYCAPEAKSPLGTGQNCGNDPTGCVQGDECLTNNSGQSLCYRICDTTAAAGTADSCPSGQTCGQLFSSLVHPGYCH